MKNRNICNSCHWLVILATYCLATTLCAQTRTLRIVTYNIEDDINGATTPLPGLIAPPGNTTDYQAGGVVEGIGEELVNGNAQPLDILALEETTSNPLTVAPIANGMNTFYGVPGMYTNSTYQATQSGSNAFGNGPNALVYNTLTLQLLASVGVGTPGGSSNGEYRQVVRYEFAPAGVAPDPTNEFYIYVSHYKSGTTSADMVDRNEEAQIIRNDEANNLPATASVLYVGDYNADNGEPMLATIFSNTAPNGIQQGQGIDPLNPNDSLTLNWSSSTSATNVLALLSESATDLRYRDDFEVMTTNVYSAAPGGLNYLPGTCHAFGNNGTTAYYGTVNSTGNTALNNSLVTNGPPFIFPSQLKLDLTDASDHLPVVADYTIQVPVVVTNPPPPTALVAGISIAGTNLIFSLANCVSNGLVTAFFSQDLTLPLTTWIPVSTNIASSNILTLTNELDLTTSQGFFYFEEQTP